MRDKSICAFCPESELWTNAIVKLGGKKPSHGICPECEAIELEKMNEETREELRAILLLGKGSYQIFMQEHGEAIIQELDLEKPTKELISEFKDKLNQLMPWIPTTY